MKPKEFLFDDDLSKPLQELQVPEEEEILAQQEKIRAQQEKIITIREQTLQVFEEVLRLRKLLAAKQKEYKEKEQLELKKLQSLKEKEKLESKKLESLEEETSKFYTWQEIKKYYYFIGLLDKRENEPVTVIHLRHIITRKDFAVKVIPILDDYTYSGIKDVADNELYGAQLANELKGDFENRFIGASGLLAQTNGFILSRELPEEEEVQIRLIEDTRFYAYIFMEYIPYGFNDIEYGEDTIQPMDFFIEIMIAIFWARTYTKFSHNDLHLGNIRIRKNAKKREYDIDEKTFQFRSKYQPCIIDFGRSDLNETSTRKSDVLTFVSSFRDHVKRPGKEHKDDIFILDDCVYNFIDKLYNEWSGSLGKGVKDTSADSKAVAEIINNWYALKDTICAKCDLKIATGICERCMFVKYCSRICQLEDYEKHKSICF